MDFNVLMQMAQRLMGGQKEPTEEDVKSFNLQYSEPEQMDDEIAELEKARMYQAKRVEVDESSLLRRWLAELLGGQEE